MRVSIVAGVAAVLVLIAYAFVVRPLEDQIAERYRALSDARRTLGDDSQLVRRIADAEAERSRLTATLARYQLAAPSAANAARFLEAAAAAAARHGTILGTLDAEPAVQSRSTARSPVAELPFRCTLRGSYPALLATLRDLMAAPVASRITLEALAPEGASHVRPIRLVAALQVALFGLPEPASVHAGSR